MNCKCGGKFIDKKDTFILSLELQIAYVVLVCNFCGECKAVFLKPTSIRDEEGVHDI